MELRVLRYFLTVVEEGNISAAAQTLFMTQPTLSRQLHDLEKELGATLFIRGKREITLTEEGILLRERAQELVSLADRMGQEFAGRKGEVSGTIAVGCVESMGSQLMAKLMVEFYKRYPRVRFQLDNMTTDDIRMRLDHGVLDVGLLIEPADTERFSFLRFPLDERWGITVRADDPLAGYEYVLPADVEKRTLIIPSRPAVRNEFLSWFGKSEHELSIMCSEALFSNSMYLVEEGGYVAFGLEGCVGAIQNPNLKFVPVFPYHATRSLMAWKKNRTASVCVKTFLDFCINYIKDNTNYDKTSGS